MLASAAARGGRRKGNRVTREMKTLGLAAAAALAVGLYGASIAGASSDRIETQVRRTVSCPTKLGALHISAFASNPTIGSANASITTGNPNTATGLLGMSNQQTRFGLNGTCHPVATRVAMTHRGLSSFLGVSHAGDVGWTSVNCPITPHVLLRFVIALDASGKPVSATIAARAQPKKRAGQTTRKSKSIGFRAVVTATVSHVLLVRLRHRTPITPPTTPTRPTLGWASVPEHPLIEEGASRYLGLLRRAATSTPAAVASASRTIPSAVGPTQPGLGSVGLSPNGIATVGMCPPGPQARQPAGMR